MFVDLFVSHYATSLTPKGLLTYRRERNKIGFFNDVLFPGLQMLLFANVFLRFDHFKPQGAIVIWCSTLVTHKEENKHVGGTAC